MGDPVLRGGTCWLGRMLGAYAMQAKALAESEVSCGGRDVRLMRRRPRGGVMGRCVQRGPV